VRTNILSKAHIYQIKAAIDYTACIISKPHRKSILLHPRNLSSGSRCLVSELHLFDRNLFRLLFAIPCIFKIIWKRATMHTSNNMEESHHTYFKLYEGERPNTISIGSSQNYRRQSIALASECRGIHFLDPIQ